MGPADPVGKHRFAAPGRPRLFVIEDGAQETAITIKIRMTIDEQNKQGLGKELRCAPT
jgi:hypothetical protein